MALIKWLLSSSAPDFMPLSFRTPHLNQISGLGNGTKGNTKHETRSSQAQWVRSGSKSNLGWTTKLHLVLCKNHTEPPFFVMVSVWKRGFMQNLSYFHESFLAEHGQVFSWRGLCLISASSQPAWGNLLLGLPSGGPGFEKPCSCDHEEDWKPSGVPIRNTVNSFISLHLAFTKTEHFWKAMG